MAEDETKYWEIARTQLVEQRQSIIRAFAKGYERGQLENHIDLLIKIQAGIDVLDKAKYEIFRSTVP